MDEIENGEEIESWTRLGKNAQEFRVKLNKQKVDEKIEKFDNIDKWRSKKILICQSPVIPLKISFHLYERFGDFQVKCSIFHVVFGGDRVIQVK